LWASAARVASDLYWWNFNENKLLINNYY